MDKRIPVLFCMMTAFFFIHTVISLMEKMIDIKGITVIFRTVCTAFSNADGNI